MARYKIIEDEFLQDRCLACGEAFYWRSNKKFCSRECRTKYYNRLALETRNIKHHVNSILKKNYCILTGLLHDKRTTVSIVDLMALGYSFEFVTSHSKCNHKDHYGCFDIMYIRTPCRIYNIRKVDSL